MSEREFEVSRAFPSNEEDQEPETFIGTVFAPNVPLKKRLWALFACVGINLGLPFINGMMLGLGEIVAHRWVGPFLGIGIYAKKNRQATTSSMTTAHTTANTSNKTHNEL